MTKKDDVVYELSRAARCYNCDRRLDIGCLIKVIKAEKPAYGDETEREVHCQECAGLSGMEIVNAGNANLTRLSKKYSSQSYVIIKWSDLWKTYERKGILAEREAIEKARAELKKDSD